MKIKELEPYCIDLYRACVHTDRYLAKLSALDEDMSIDRYQDTQPGGGDCVDVNRASYEIYEKKLETLGAENVFESLYAKSSDSDRELLFCLLDKCKALYQWAPYSEFELVYQMVLFLEQFCDTKYANKKFEKDDIELLVSGGQHFVNLAYASYDKKNEKVTFVPSANEVVSFMENKKDN